MPTKQQRLQLIVQAKDQTGRVLTQVNNDLSRLVSLATGPAGVAAALLLVGKQAYATYNELGALGARADRTSDTFVSLVGNADAAQFALAGLRRVTKRGVDDQTLMAASSKFLSMNLAETVQEAEHLAYVSTQLGMAMNMPGGPTQSMNYFALLLANKSIRRLDEFGISATRVRERLSAMGSSVANDADFMAAVMAEAGVTMERVGEQSVTAWEAQEVAVANLKTEIGLYLAEMTGIPGILADVAQGVTEVMRAGRSASQVMAPFNTILAEQIEYMGLALSEEDKRIKGLARIEAQLANGTLTVAEAIAAARELLGVYRDWRDDLADVTKLEGEHEDQLEAMADAHIKAGKAALWHGWAIDQLRWKATLGAEKGFLAIITPEEEAKAIAAIKEYGREVDAANREWQAEVRRQQDEYLSEMRSAVEGALTATTVTEEDLLRARLGIYADKWDEMARRAEDVAARGLESPWAAMFEIPEDVLAGGPERVRLYMRGVAREIRVGQRPEMVDWAAFEREYARIVEEREARKRLVEEGMRRVGGGRADVAAALGLPVDPATQATALATGYAQVDMGGILIKTLATQMETKRGELVLIGQTIATYVAVGFRDLAPATADNWADALGPALFDWLEGQGAFGGRK